MIQIGWSHWNTGNVFYKVGQLHSYLKPENIRTRSHSKLKGSCGIATIICKAEIVVMAGWSWIFTGLERNNEALHAPQRTAGGTGILIPRQSSPHLYINIIEIWKSFFDYTRMLQMESEIRNFLRLTTTAIF